MKIIVMLISLSLFLSSCDGLNTHTEDKTEKPDSTSTNKAVTEIDTLNIACDPIHQQYAALISGDSTFNFDEQFKPLITDSGFKKFSSTINSRWSNFEQEKLSALKTWQSAHLKYYPDTVKTVFYPFSGPDILFATQFYPQATNFVLIGLEPVGTYPSLSDTSFTKHIGKYYNNINTSLNAILKFSFFRTLSMEADFKNTHVNGTLHLLNLFLTKMNYSVCSSEPMAIDTNGKAIIVDSFEALAKSQYAGKGIHIHYLDNAKQKKELTYWSADVSDENMLKHPELLVYLKGMDNTMHTYMKGASYLCYLANFDEIRNVILAKSKTLLQDDSGVPVRFFLNPDWQLHFFGTYKKPINLFAHKYQARLDSIYNKAPNKPEALDFGIGYIYEDKASNMMLGVRK